MFWYKNILGYAIISLSPTGKILTMSLSDVKEGEELTDTMIKAALDSYFYSQTPSVVVDQENTVNNDIKDGKTNCLVSLFTLEDLTGTDFQKKVWGIIVTIPFGETMTYKNIAEKIGKPLSFRAVGTACGKNPLALCIPCHRVVRSSGEDFQYSWGRERKEWLLRHEKEYVF